MTQLRKKNKLPASQRLAAELLATVDVHKKTNAEIADEVGIAPRTLYRWKHDIEFIKYQNSIAEVAMESVISETYATLKTLLREGKSEKIQLEAIKLILQNRGKLVDKQEHVHEVKQSQTLEDLEAEIIDMENDLLD